MPRHRLKRHELKAAGHEYDVREVGAERSHGEARITLTVTINGMPTSVHRPDNTVTVSFYRTETQIKKDKMSVTGQLGNYAGSEITGTVNDTT
jgi:hypothetical protein